MADVFSAARPNLNFPYPVAYYHHSEVCAHARPPQKRVPRRVFPRLREPLEFATRRVLEDESDVDLVYPDDVPTASGPNSTADEDVELELVYPEDVQDATPTAPPKPTTLRQLFMEGLQRIHTLQDRYQTAPRQCRVQGCNEVLPAQTCMERCVKCTIDDWKRRKSEAADASLAMETEEEQVTTTILDTDNALTSSPGKSSSTKCGNNNNIPGWDSDLTDLSGSESESLSDSDPDPDSGPAQPEGDTTGLTIRIPLFVHQLSQDAPLRKCGSKRCNIALPKDHRWKTCDPCRQAHRVYQRTRLENQRRSALGMEVLVSSNPLCRRWRSLSPDMDGTETTLTPETSRPCAIKHCPRQIPLPEVYRWKMCVRCRANARRNARKKRDALVAAQHASSPPEIVPRFPTYQNRGALLASFDAQLKGFVQGQIMYLRAKLHESEVARGWRDGASHDLERIPMVFVFMGEYSVVTGQRSDSDVEGEEREEGGGTPDRDHDLARSPPDPTTQEAMCQEVSGIVSELERALRTTFSTTEGFAIDEGGMIMRFTCALELIAQLRPLRSSPGVGGSGPTPSEVCARDHIDEVLVRRQDVCLPPQRPSGIVPLVKTFSGELETVVLPDESHRLFHGRRTVIRYCMFG